MRDSSFIAATGDCIGSRQLAPLAQRDPALGEVASILRGAVVAYANLESSLVDLHTYRGIPRGGQDWSIAAPPSVARDLRALGIGVVSLANNHTMDWGIEGMRETMKWLDDAGISYAGAGEDLTAARAPVYVETSAGRVGLVSATVLEHGNADGANDCFATVPARPGVNGLHVERIVGVPRSGIELIRSMRDLVEPWSAGSQQLSLAGYRIVASDAVELTRMMDADDLEALCGSITAGKAHCDRLLVAVHVHDEDRSPVAPPVFLQELARAAVDAGADAVLCHGIHRLMPIEVYHDRPVLYGLGNFIATEIQEGLHRGMYREAEQLIGGPMPGASDAEVMRALNEALFDDPVYHEGVVAELAIADGDWIVRLTPIELGFDRPHSARGVPRRATSTAGHRILQRLQDMSASLGTSIDVTGGVGIVAA